MRRLFIIVLAVLLTLAFIVPVQGEVFSHKDKRRSIPTYLLRDEFITADPNPLASPRTSEPGPGTVTFRDVEGVMDIDANGWLNFGAQATAAYADEDMVFTTPPIVRAPGKVFITSWKCTTDGPQYPLALVDSTTPAWNHTNVRAAFWRSSALTLSVVGNQAVGPAVGAFVADGTVYKLAIILQTSGARFYIKGGTYTYWTKLYQTVVDTATPLYLAAAGNTAVFALDFDRSPAQRWLDSPLLYTTGAMTWPTTNGYAGDGGLGAGGSGKIMLDAGTWAVSGGYIYNTPVEESELLTNGNMEVGDPPSNWVNMDGGTASSVADERTGGSGSKSLNLTGTAYGSKKQSFTSVVGAWYRLDGWLRSVSGNEVYITLRNGELTGGTIFAFDRRYTDTSWVNSRAVGRAISTTTRVQLNIVNSADNGRFDDISVKLLPISSLITNCQQSTTEVLAEEVIHAFTLGSQVGMVQSDRSFAAKCASTAAAAQAVIALKEIADETATGLTTNDTITIKHAGGDVTYTIASIDGVNDVAYNDTTKTQTVTLGAVLSEEVAADDKVGLDWKAWNGVLVYFDGLGNIKLDKVVAGVYTNLVSAAKAFSADARFIVRKIGSSYYIFYNEARIGTTALVDAAAMAGTYWGMFSTLSANQITSFRVDDTGNVTNAHSILDKWSQTVYSFSWLQPIFKGFAETFFPPKYGVADRYLMKKAG